MNCWQWVCFYCCSLAKPKQMHCFPTQQLLFQFWKLGRNGKNTNFTVLAEERRTGGRHVLGPHSLMLLVGFAVPASALAQPRGTGLLHAMQYRSGPPPWAAGSAPHSSLLLQGVARGCWAVSAPPQELLLAVSTVSLHRCLLQLSRCHPKPLAGLSGKVAAGDAWSRESRRLSSFFSPLFHVIIPCYNFLL